MKKDISEEDIIEIMSDMWQHLTGEQRIYLMRQMSVAHYAKKDFIYSEGDKPTQLMCLVSGKVKIHKDGVGGRSQIMRMVKPVGYFGYRAYFANENYVTAATAFEPSIVCLIPLEALEHVMNENNALAMFFVRQLSVDLGMSDTRTVGLTQKHVRGRLAEALLFLKKTYGVEEDGHTLNINPSREDLASLSNMTTSNAIRTLSNFATEKIINIDGRNITILEEEKLRKISRIG